MKQLQPFGDAREMSFCVHCGGETETRDHIPSRVLLDRPYPENLPVVSCCRICNESFSADEEYVAALVDCVIVGTPEPSARHREKVRRILDRQKGLATLLRGKQGKLADGDTVFEADMCRVENVALKLGRGHAAFELHSPQLNPPLSVFISPLKTMTKEQVDRFESLPESGLFPEVGSRAMSGMFEHGIPSPSWIVVQEGRYRFLASAGGFLLVRFVLSEYLACEVVWVN